MPDLFSLTCDEIPPEAHVVAFQGEEALSRPYRFEIGLSLRAGMELDLDAVPSCRATLTIALGDDRPPQVIHGVIASIELMHSWREQSLYRAVLVPLFWTLTLTHHSKVFVEMTVPDIVEEVLQESGLTPDDYELRLSGSYEPQLHVMQYQESNFNFVCRLLEREGIYFFFDHGGEQELLVLTDDKSFHKELDSGTARYVPATGEDDQMAREALNTWRCQRPMLPAEVIVSDYDYLHPSLELTEPKDVDGAGQISIYGENFRSSGVGKQIVKVRAEAFLVQKKVYRGAGRVFNLRPGYRFKLDEHPQPSMNAQYLVTRLVHDGNQSGTNPQIQKLLNLDTDDEYRVQVEAIPKDVQFRPQLDTPIPRIEGVLHAQVAGPADSIYAQLDDHGRYKVYLLLDERGADNGKASTWVRMLQFHAGGTEGAHFPLRKGTEVMIIFLGGDPDRPMIVGAIPNAQKPAPVTKSNYTLNMLITGSSNYLAMQDEDGAQWIDLSTPPQSTWMHLGEPHSDVNGTHTHYIVLNTDGDCLFNIGSDQDIEVGGDLTEHVVGDVTETYDSDQDSIVAGDQTLEVGGDRDIEVGGDQTVEIGGDNDIEVGGDQTLEVGGDQDITVGANITVQAGAAYDATTGADVTWTAGGNWTGTIAGKHSVTAAEKDFWTLGNEAKGTIGSTFEIFIGNKAEIKIGNFLEAAISNKLGMHVGSDIVLAAALKLDVVGGAHIEANSAVKVEVEGAPKVQTAATILEAAGMILHM
ncbi:MAG: type VI secretion system tip protein VgrG [Deltaproteobacteria bacterium]|jgi:type VI secretion system secreted protein VgrG|nr:type VI secretion system tip protein VgrG [Deltaproteobacteria bacterium]MBW2532524.1 type VI secretion system tip protein VgrG [Deltaproteobacteria bacterium]